MHSKALAHKSTLYLLSGMTFPFCSQVTVGFGFPSASQLRYIHLVFGTSVLLGPSFITGGAENIKTK